MDQEVGGLHQRLTNLLTNSRAQEVLQEELLLALFKRQCPQLQVQPLVLEQLSKGYPPILQSVMQYFDNAHQYNKIFRSMFVCFFEDDILLMIYF